MRQALVTIAMPAYNHERYIEEAINSTIEQSYENIEFIIIDDGSKDNTKEIIKRLENKCKERFVNFIYEEQENKGISYTLNKILDMAKGEYFIIISSDDTQTKNRVEENIRFFEKNPEYDFCYAGYNDIDEKGNIINITFPDESFELDFEDILFRRLEISYTNYMAKTKSLIKIGGYISGIKIEDWELALRVTKNNLKTNFLNISTYNHRFHGNNTITKYDEMFIDRLDIINRYKEYPKYVDAIDFWKTFYSKYFSKYNSYKLISDMYKEIIKYNNSALNIVIYGNGTIGKIIEALIPKSNYCFVDKLSKKEFYKFKKQESYSKNSLFKIEFDYIFISVFYQNDIIENELISFYKIEAKKIIKFE